MSTTVSALESARNELPTFGDRLMDLFLSPINGLFGVMNVDGFIGPYESGELYGAAGVFLFVLAIGIFITMAMRTGAKLIKPLLVLTCIALAVKLLADPTHPPRQLIGV